jgi:hypothetical protein
MKKRDLAILLYYFSLALAGMGLLMQSRELMSLSMIGAALGYALRDYFSVRHDSITPMTVNALFVGVWWGLGHLVALYVVDTPYEERFFAYSDMNFLLEAQILALVTVIVPPIAYRWAARLSTGSNRVVPALPSVRFNVSDKTLLRLVLVLVGVDWSGRLAELSFGFLGTLATFLVIGSEIAVFLLAWHWFGPSPTLPRWTKGLLAGVLVLDVGHSFLFSSMRGEVAYPIFMVGLAYLMRKAITRRGVLVIGCLLVGIALVYTSLGEMRKYRVMGTQRITTIREGTVPGYSEGVTIDSGGVGSSILTLIARGCQYGQLSQVARIVDEEGFYEGETLRYLTYAFIPRAIWPEKPTIAPGQWFAAKIGHAQLVGENRYSNSINMTVAGELYLNFGWTAAILGMVVLGAAFAFVWRATEVYVPGNNPIGQILAVVLLRHAVGGSSTVVIVNMIFVYVAALAVHSVLVIVNKPTSPLKAIGARAVVRSGV